MVAVTFWRNLELQNRCSYEPWALKTQNLIRERTMSLLLLSFVFRNIITTGWKNLWHHRCFIPKLYEVMKFCRSHIHFQIYEYIQQSIASFFFWIAIYTLNPSPNNGKATVYKSKIKFIRFEIINKMSKNRCKFCRTKKMFCPLSVLSVRNRVRSPKYISAGNNAV